MPVDWSVCRCVSRAKSSSRAVKSGVERGVEGVFRYWLVVSGLYLDLQVVRSYCDLGPVQSVRQGSTDRGEKVGGGGGGSGYTPRERRRECVRDRERAREREREGAS